MKGNTDSPLTSVGLFEVGIYGLVALDIHRLAETTWRLKDHGLTGVYYTQNTWQLDETVKL